jgi:hypothetical protein
MSDRSQRDGVPSDLTSQQPSRLQEIAAELRSAGCKDTSEGRGRRRPMEPLSLYPADATVGLEVATGWAPFPPEAKTVTTIEPRPRLVVCTVDFAPAIRESLVESLSGSLRRAYPHTSAPRGPAGPQVFFSDPDRNWAVWFTSSVVGLETNRFKELGELQDRLGAVMRFLDAGLYYKRVGLRSVYHVPSSWSVASRPLPPDQQHLVQVVKWKSHRGQAYFDLDVFTENVQSASLDEHLKEIFQASRRLAPGAAAAEEQDDEPVSGGGSAPPVRSGMATAVAAYPELVPFDTPVPAEPSEVELVASARAELVARKYGGQGLSQTERERLDSLTARLEELLLPVSVRELEALVEMAEEAERVRERARERRQRLSLS